jgi:hypothetical protein
MEWQGCDIHFLILNTQKTRCVLRSVGWGVHLSLPTPYPKKIYSYNLYNLYENIDDQWLAWEELRK